VSVDVTRIHGMYLVRDLDVPAGGIVRRVREEGVWLGCSIEVGFLNSEKSGMKWEEFNW
jgi:hypothetical protein